MFYSFTRGIRLTPLFCFIQGRETDSKTTVFKKTDEVYQLKLKASRAFLSEVDRKFGTLPFTLRSLEEESKARMGVVECVNHKLVEPFNVLYEKDGEFVAQFKYTVLLMPLGSHKITGLLLDLELFESENKIEDETIKGLLQRSVAPKAAKNKKKKPAAKTGEAGDVETPAKVD